MTDWVNGPADAIDEGIRQRLRIERTYTEAEDSAITELVRVAREGRNWQRTVRGIESPAAAQRAEMDRVDAALQRIREGVARSLLREK